MKVLIICEGATQPAPQQFDLVLMSFLQAPAELDVPNGEACGPESPTSDSSTNLQVSSFFRPLHSAYRNAGAFWERQLVPVCSAGQHPRCLHYRSCKDQVASQMHECHCRVAGRSRRQSCARRWVHSQAAVLGCRTCTMPLRCWASCSPASTGAVCRCEFQFE